MKITAFEQISQDKDLLQWESFVNQHEEGNTFQSIMFYQFLKEIDQYNPSIIVVRENGTIVGGVLFFLVSQSSNKYISRYTSRIIIWGGPLLSNKVADRKSMVKALLKEVNKTYRKKPVYVEVRNLFDTERLKDGFFVSGYRYISYLNYLIDLKTDYFSRFKSEKRRQVRKSQKNDLIVREAANIEEVKELYKILEKVYTERVKKPLPDINLFETFYNFSREKKLGVVLVLIHDKVVIGGSFCLIFKNVIYDWYRAGDDFNYKKLYPSTVAAWGGMEYGEKNGFEVFDFMGAGKADEEYGVRDFKSQFGGELVEYGRFLKINRKWVYRLAELYIRFKK